MIKTKNTSKYLALLDWLRDARIKRKLSMRELGSLMDEPHTFVSKVEAEERRLSVYEYVQYCQALDLDPAEGLRFLL